VRLRSALAEEVQWWIVADHSEYRCSIVWSAEDESTDYPLHDINVHITLQVPEPTQVVKARTSNTVYIRDTVYMLLKTEFSVRYPDVTDNISRLNYHRVNREGTVS